MHISAYQTLECPAIGRSAIGRETSLQAASAERQEPAKRLDAPLTLWVLGDCVHL